MKFSLQRLRAISLDDVEGQKVKISSTWDDQTVLLVFIRHFG
jgi:hypothetical protein